MKVSGLLQTTSVVLAMISAAPSMAQDYVGWLERGEDKEAWAASKAQLQAFGEQFEDSQALFAFLKAQADGGIALTWEDMKKPEYDWSGIFTRTGGGLSFDPDIKASELSAVLTEEGTAAYQKKVDQMAATGGEYDPISDCRPPGFPRWITEPFLHEFIVTPEQTWLVNEMVNDVRRVYTDGRDHTAPEDAYPTWNGDTIGFWDGDVLVTHTTYLVEGQYQRGTQPNYSDQVEAVERWKKVDGVTLQADVWIFDPVNLAEPWYTRQSWTELANDDHLLRIRYWDCRENSNNQIVQLEDGTSQFPDLDFVNSDAPTN